MGSPFSQLLISSEIQRNELEKLMDCKKKNCPPPPHSQNVFMKKLFPHFQVQSHLMNFLFDWHLLGIVKIVYSIVANLAPYFQENAKIQMNFVLF
jgi:hypothetical protein